MGLFLQSTQQSGELEGDCEVRGEFGSTVKDKAKIEEKFIARIMR